MNERRRRGTINRLTNWVHATLGVSNPQGAEYLRGMQEKYGSGGTEPPEATLVYRSEIESVHLEPDKPSGT
ncbi:MAG: hypothetical protein UT24_C0014G0039 [Candidatus Woesebacteria bacterium GW2011_GWB1_39_12]|uniref:Uncharacterized protein n=2 Tax=Candidatus Woeseibacteriota TaxID=1752722 RepID=A0A0G0PJH9_9BACT|nr:MAG: hypothetical protein UT23_C0004G0063 [Candidatus Woesebacteria bacterium GW2011_GWA1_39_12]KKR00299.1 MAG: hypothetical protein UT24_C0014G0039 [Candidatus Woesebacteria bacterium GW2011_GWB1_39_12]